MEKTLKMRPMTKFYTYLVCMLPLVSIYSSGLPGINFGELLLILLLLVYGIVVYPQKTRNTYPLIILFIYTVLISLISLYTNDIQFAPALIRMVRFLFYLTVICILSSNLFDTKLAYKVIEKTSLIATCFIVFQKLVYTQFNIIIKGFLSFLPLYTNDYATLDYASFYNISFYRPTSFFLEPAHYSQFVLIGLVICLFNNHSKKRSYAKSLFLTVGIFLSTSGQGLIIASIIWIIFFIYTTFTSSVSIRFKLITVFSIVILIVNLNSIMSIGFVQDNILRLSNFGPNSAYLARLEGYISYFNSENGLMKIFGSGYGNTPFNVWFSGFSYILYTLGLLGLILLFNVFISAYFRANSVVVKMLIFLTIALSLSAEIINSYWIIFTFSLFLFPESKNNEEYLEGEA